MGSEPDPSAPRTIIVQEQTITTEDVGGQFAGYAAANTFDFSTLSVGDSAVMTVGGVDIDAEVIETDQGALAIVPSGAMSLSPAFVYMDVPGVGTECAFVTDAAGTYVVSCSAAGTVLVSKWETPVGALTVTSRGDGGIFVMDKTWSQIDKAFKDGLPIVVKHVLSDSVEYATFFSTYTAPNEWGVYILLFNTESGTFAKLPFVTDSDDGYPQYHNK